MGGSRNADNGKLVPVEIMRHIFSFFPVKERGRSIPRVCTLWNNIHLEMQKANPLELKIKELELKIKELEDWIYHKTKIGIHYKSMVGHLIKNETLPKLKITFHNTLSKLFFGRPHFAENSDPQKLINGADQFIKNQGLYTEVFYALLEIERHQNTKNENYLIKRRALLDSANVFIREDTPEDTRFFLSHVKSYIESTLPKAQETHTMTAGHRL
ncbi:MAG: hypothetical protein A3F12_07360 [Gammaproteobacteria bacterium RIFCSPHIGHO2_12_FULL_38_14]|nr:MAG: hypothetical protein A3F12_07360 [Gammaproteobacteria bacterium RIFCSPHIGHO2_12_FULL_38_14]